MHSQLQLQDLGRDVGLLQHLAHQIRQLRLVKLPGRQVHRHGQMQQAFVAPRFELLGCCGHDPLANGQNQATAFCNRNKFSRRDGTQLRMLPAQQRLHAQYLAGVGIDLRLVVQAQLLTL